MQEETISWMNSRLLDKNRAELIEQFGTILSEATDGEEPTLEEINKPLKK